MKKLIRVTQQHIQDGVKGSASSCPVALALKDEFPTKRIKVFGRNVLLGRSTKRVSQSVKQFVHDFDYTNNAVPFNFFVEVPR